MGQIAHRLLQRLTAWRTLTKRVLSSTYGVAAALSAVAGIASAVIALVTLMLR